MTIRYNAATGWLARKVADLLLHGRLEEFDSSNWLFADVRPLLDVVDVPFLKRRAVFEWFGTHATEKRGTDRPVVLDWIDIEGGTRWELHGIGLTEAGREWLIQERWLPRHFLHVIEDEGFYDPDALKDPNFLYWRENIYIAPPEHPPVGAAATKQGTQHDKARTYTQAERIVALAEIAARTDIDARAKAAHKAHVTRRTVAA